MILGQRAMRWWDRKLAPGAALVIALVLLAGCASLTPDPLPSWNEGPTKAAIVKLVSETTRAGGPDYVPPAERIATFDNDGTLWSEHPMYVEMLFTQDRIKALAAQNPAWRTQLPFKAFIDEDRAAMAKLTQADFFQMIAATHSGLTSAQFQSQAAEAGRHATSALQPALYRARLPADARSPRLLSRQRLQDVHRVRRHVEFHAELRGQGIRSSAGAGDRELVQREVRVHWRRGHGHRRADADAARRRSRQGHRHRSLHRPRPIAAFGNSDGDLAMLETTTNSPTSKQRMRLAAFVWHTDAVREYAYDRETSVGRLNQGLDLAPRLGWHLIDMKKDWKVVFPFELK